MFFPFSVMYILMNVRPTERAPECKSSIDAPPREPPRFRPRLAISSIACASDEDMMLSEMRRPHFSGAHPAMKTKKYNKDKIYGQLKVISMLKNNFHMITLTWVMFHFRFI